MAVSRIGSWARSTGAGGATPTHTHAPVAGSERAFVLVLSTEHTTTPTQASWVKFNGRRLSRVTAAYAASTLVNGIEIWVCNEANVALMNTAGLEMEWNGDLAPDQGSQVSTVYRAGVSQRDLVRSYSEGGEASSATVQADAAIEVVEGDLALYGAVSGAATTHSASSGYSEGVDAQGGSQTHATADDIVDATGTTQPTATFAGSSRAAIAVIVLAASGAVVPPAWSLEVDSDNDDTWDASEDDLTGDVEMAAGVSVDRGGSITGRSVSPQAGSLQATLFNEAGTYNPASSVSANKPIRLHAAFGGTDYSIWQHRIGNVQQLPELATPRVSITANDALNVLVEAGDGYSTPLYRDITTDVALEHIMDAVGIPDDVAHRTIDTGNRTIAAFWLSASDDVWIVIQRLMAFEGPHARLYGGRDGEIVFEANDFRASGVGASTQETFNVLTASQPWVSYITGHDRGRERIVNSAVFPRKVLDYTAPDQSVGSPVYTYNSASVTTTDVNIASANVGDTILVCFSAWNGGTFAVTGGGWDSVAATGQDMVIFYRVADGTEGTINVTWTNPAAAQAVSITVAGAPDYSPVHATATAETSTQEAAPQLTTTVPDTFLILFGADETQAGSGTPTQLIADYRPGTVGMRLTFKRLTSTVTTSSQVCISTALSGQKGGIVLAFTVPQVVPVWSYGSDLVLGNDEAIEITIDTGGPFDSAVMAITTDYVKSVGTLVSGPTLSRTSGSSLVLSMTAGAGGCTITNGTGTSAPGMRIRAHAYAVLSVESTTSSDGTSQTAYGVQRADVTPWEYADADEMQASADDRVAAGKDLREMLVAHVPMATGTACEATLGREISERLRVDVGNVDVTGWLEHISYEAGINGNGWAHMTIIETTAGGL